MENRIMDMDQLEEITSIIRALGHPLRLRIIDFISLNGPQRVTEIVAISEGTNQAAVSQQLKILRDTNLLTTNRKGNNVYYSLHNNKIIQIIQSIKDLKS